MTRRPARRWIAVATAIALTAVLLAVGGLIADGLAKDYALDYVRDRVAEAFRLDSAEGIEVRIEGSVLLQSLRGELDAVEARVPEAAFGGLRGSAEVRAEGVPLDAADPVELLRIRFSVAEPDLAVLAGNLSGLELESVGLDEPEVVVGGSFTLLGAEIPVGMGLEPGAVAGELVFTPTSVRVGDAVFEAEALRADPMLGSLARRLLQQRAFCVAEHLPAALAVTGVEVRGGELVIAITGDGASLDGPDLAIPGSCRAA